VPEFSHVFILSLSLFSLSLFSLSLSLFSPSPSLFFSLLAGAFLRAAYYQSGNKAGVY